jgi:predicted dehydrogenase
VILLFLLTSAYRFLCEDSCSPIPNAMKRPNTRRQFIKASVAATAGLTILRSGSARTYAANEKLNVAVIGVANQGAYNLGNVSSQNVVALCDINEGLLAGAAQKHPSARTYTDFRHLLDQKDVEAVVVATPDHTHAVATAAAIRSGRHVYCEKPLTRTVAECRRIQELAREHRCVTQMGTQIHAGSNYRRVVELVQSGAIGNVSEVHVWVGGGFGNKERPKDTPAIPKGLHYDLWLGPAEERPYHPDYLPFSWRHWWAFGGGTLADIGCHYMDLPHWALELRHPLTVEAEGPPVHTESAANWLIARYLYPARGEKPPVNLTWYHGNRRPPQFAEKKLPKWGNGVLFVGSKGMLICDYGKHVLLPEKDFTEFTTPEPVIKDSIGHHLEWIEACKHGGPTTCDFDYSGPLTEAVLLGNVAFRSGKKLEWDPKKLRATGAPEADQFIDYRYRKGWAL